MKRSLPGKPVKNGRFNSGLYLLVAPTKGGKTLCSLALSISEDYSYLYVNEPRSIVENEFINFYNGAGLVDRESLLKGLNSIERVGIIIDSIGDLFQSPRREAGLGKGMSFDQQIYFKSVQRVCFKKSVTLIGTVNSRLVPSIENFEGTTEGYITIQTIKNLTYIDRDSRRDVNISLNKDVLNEACTLLGYGPYRDTTETRELYAPNSVRF